MNLALVIEEQHFSPRLVAERLMTSQDEIARTMGLGRDSVARKDRVASPKTQTRLRELVELINRLSPRFGSDLVAYAWLRSEPLPGFGGQTAAGLMQQGKADAVIDYIDAVDAGGFA